MERVREGFPSVTSLEVFLFWKQHMRSGYSEPSLLNVFIDPNTSLFLYLSLSYHLFPLQLYFPSFSLLFHFNFPNKRLLIFLGRHLLQCYQHISYQYNLHWTARMLLEEEFHDVLLASHFRNEEVFAG